MTENKISRRQFLKYGGAGMVGLGLSTLNLPFFRMGKAAAALSDSAWSFGVMADTQWRTGSSYSDGEMSVATGIIDALNNQFIQHGCKFVVQVGDLVNNESVDGQRAMPTRAAHSQALYDEGIGFFPVRGNHESSETAANEIPHLFPQTLGREDMLYGATNVQQSGIEGLAGLTYAFDYENVRCIMLDQFVRADGTNYNGQGSYDNNMLDQIDWTEAMLASNNTDGHAFVFAHKNLIGQSHKDNLFGDGLTSNAAERDRFLSILNRHNVGYYMGGHDHMHHRSLVSDSQGDNKVNQIICSSNSYKFYTPFWGDDGRETPLAQELFTVGYYIVTVEGPRVTVDFYSASHGKNYQDVNMTSVPDNMIFYLRDRFGYSLNGQRHEIAQGESYTGISSTYNKTTAQILDGANDNTEWDRTFRPLSKTVNTGWADSGNVNHAASEIFTLWGLADNLSMYDSADRPLPDSNESQTTDQYTLSISYNPRKIRASRLMRGDFAIAARNENGEWVNAVSLNDGGAATFVRGPWKSGYGLGTYGVDPGTKTVWAVLNHESDFVAKLIE